jgi:DNA-binding MarR family transcriptional regulator
MNKLSTKRLKRIVLQQHAEIRAMMPTKTQGLILDYLQSVKRPKTVQQIMRRLKMERSRIAGQLTFMVDKGLVSRVGRNQYEAES